MRFKLLSKHYFPGDLLVDEGTIVGDGTPYPVTQPSNAMDPLDDEAQAAVDKHMKDRLAPERPAPASALGHQPALGPKPPHAVVGSGVRAYVNGPYEPPAPGSPEAAREAAAKAAGLSVGPLAPGLGIRGGPIEPALSGITPEESKRLAEADAKADAETKADAEKAKEAKDKADKEAKDKASHSAHAGSSAKK